jgi:hypothetical protein
MLIRNVACQPGAERAPLGRPKAPLLAAALGIAMVTLGTGCSWQTVGASCANVPNPVLLGPVDRVKGHAAEPNAQKLADVDTDIEASITSSSRSSADGTMTVTTTTFHKEGGNKASFAVLAATQGDKTQDVRLTKLGGGAYTFIPLAAVKTKYWVSVQGDAVRSAK